VLEALSGLEDRSVITALVVSATALALATLEIARLRHSLRRQRSAVAVAEREDDSSREVESLAALAGGIAHDFRNLLTVILGNASLLRRELPETSGLRERAERIHTYAGYAAEITEQLMDYVGGACPKLEPFDLVELIGETTALLRAELPRNVALESEADDARVEIDGDPAQIRRVAMNLVSNAVEALGDGGGRVRIAMRRARADEEQQASLPAHRRVKGECVILEVRDDGPGMDAATRRRLFEPFFTTKAEGRGLGLPAVQGIIRGHGGVVSVESEAGQGTCFRVILPIRSSRRRMPAGSDSEREAAVRTGPAAPRDLALVIGRDRHDRAASERMAGERGFALLMAADLREVSELLDEHGQRVALAWACSDLADWEINDLRELFATRSDSIPLDELATEPGASSSAGEPDRTGSVAASLPGEGEAAWQPPARARSAGRDLA
jgi:signal transduction histidine kinase